MDVEKVIAEALDNSKSWSVNPVHGGLGFDREMAARDVTSALTANGLTVVPNEVVEALRPFAAISEHLSSFDPQDEDIINWGLVPKDFHFAAMQLAKLDQPQ